MRQEDLGRLCRPRSPPSRQAERRRPPSGLSPPGRIVGGVRLRILDESDITAIDEATRALLDGTGLNVQSEAAREALTSWGARTTKGSTRVRIPERTLVRALESAPKEILLASRDRNHDLRIPDGRTRIATDGCGVNVWDLETGVRRPSTSKDLGDLTRVADALNAVDLVWPMAAANDVPSRIHDLVEAAVTFQNTSKHVQHEALSRGDAEKLVGMSAAIAGGREELRARPVFSAVQCPVSPLTLEEGATEALLVLARAGVPVVPMSMVLMGGSSPVDLASALVLSNAESLASLCVAQAAAPGSPVIWSVTPGPIDMRTGALALGSPESAVANAAAVELARHYELPCMITGFHCDSDSPGIQAGAEKAGTGLLSVLAGADLLAGIGGIETASTLSLEQLVLDADVVDWVRRAQAPVRVATDTINLDLLRRVGPGGNFLKEKHTLQHFREAIWSPTLFLRDGHVPGRTAEHRIRERAQARAREILRTHEPSPLDADVRKALWTQTGIPPP